MDPNNNQPITTNPVAQPAPQPVPPTEATAVVPTPAPTVSPEAPPASQNASGAPKKGMGKGIILIVILLLLVLGMAAYIMFAKSQLNNTQKAATDDTSSVLPAPTTVPTLAPEEDLEIGSPEGDLLELDADVKGL